jgi:hypothetical protein
LGLAWVAWLRQRVASALGTGECFSGEMRRFVEEVLARGQ